jgi:hypothetical protein
LSAAEAWSEAEAEAGARAASEVTVRAARASMVVRVFMGISCGERVDRFGRGHPFLALSPQGV